MSIYASYNTTLQTCLCVILFFVHCEKRRVLYGVLYIDPGTGEWGAVLPCVTCAVLLLLGRA